MPNQAPITTMEAILLAEITGAETKQDKLEAVVQAYLMSLAKVEVETGIKFDELPGAPGTLNTFQLARDVLPGYYEAVVKELRTLRGFDVPKGTGE